MKKFLILALLLSSSIVSCDKEKGNFMLCNACGTIIYKNQSSDIYKMYFNDEYLKDVQGNSEYKFTTRRGGHKVKAVQSTNVNGTAIEIEENIAINEGSVREFIFP